MLPQHARDRGTAFAIGRTVWQQVGIAKAFVAILPSSHGAGNIGLASHDIVPDAVQRFFVTGCLTKTKDVGHCRIHVAGPNRMTDRLILIDHRFVILHPTVAHPQSGMEKSPALFGSQFSFRFDRLNDSARIKGLARSAVGMPTLIEEKFC